MKKISATITASVSAAMLAAGAATTAFAAPSALPIEVSAPTPTISPAPHHSMAGMDPNMPGMDHGDMAGMSDEEMPGMNHGTPASHDSSGHSYGSPSGTEAARPQAAVIGSFAVVNGGVLVTAGLLRRRAKRTGTARSSRTDRLAT